MDYWSAIVGVLSLLVTALIGWQVINVWEVHKKISYLEEFCNDLQDKCAKVSTRCSKIEESVLQKEKNLKKHIEEKIHYERIVFGLLRQYLELFNNPNADDEQSFKSYCRIAESANKLEEWRFRDEALDRAMIIYHKIDTSNIKADDDFYKRVKPMLDDIYTDDAKELKDFIKIYKIN